jgi:putative DNA primase/helicase
VAVVSAASAIAQAIGGRRAQRLANGGYLLPCPVPSHGKGRGDRQPSLSIADGNKGILVKCFGGCDPRAVLDELRRRGLLDDARRQPVGRPRVHKADANNISIKPERPQRSGVAASIWREALPAMGTPVETYLANRPGRLVLPPRCDAIRFHPRCPFGKDDNGRTIYTPAMIALVRNIVTDEPQAIHRTAIDERGRKRTELGGNGRLSLGPTVGGAVKLVPDEDITIAIGVAEGIETALSLRCIPKWFSSPVWAVLYWGGIKAFDVLPGVETLVVAVDHDQVGELAAREVAERWNAAGLEVLLFEANQDGSDLNDVVGGAE